MDPERSYILLRYRDTYKSLNDLNQEELRSGGLRINPVTNISSTITYFDNLKIRKIAATDEIQVTGLPQNPRISNISMSPDEKKIAFTNTTNTGIELWVIDLEIAKAERLTESIVNANMGNPVSWLNDNQNLLVTHPAQNQDAMTIQKKIFRRDQPFLQVTDLFPRIRRFRICLNKVMSRIWKRLSPPTRIRSQ